jgi:hypothetical protein
VFHNETFMEQWQQHMRRNWLQVLEKPGQGAVLALGTPLA